MRHEGAPPHAASARAHRRCVRLSSRIPAPIVNAWRPRWIFVDFKIPEVGGSLVSARAWSFRLHRCLSGVAASRGNGCIGHILSGSVALEIAEQVLRRARNLVARVIVARTRNVTLVTQVVHEALLAWAPGSCAWVFNCAKIIHPELINFDSCFVSSRTWNVLFDILVETIYSAEFSRFWLLTVVIDGPALEGELSALSSHIIQRTIIGSRTWLMRIFVRFVGCHEYLFELFATNSKTVDAGFGHGVWGAWSPDFEFGLQVVDSGVRRS